MAKRKISIEEALTALHEQGVKVTVQQVEEQQHHAKKQPVEQSSTPKRIGKTAVTIKLFAKHCIGSGGQSNGDSAEQQETLTFGPGIVTVPTKYADHLLHQDMLAKQADERFFDRRERSFLIAQRFRPDGGMGLGVVEVSDNLLDNPNSIPAHMMLHIR